MGSEVDGSNVFLEDSQNDSTICQRNNNGYQVTVVAAGCTRLPNPCIPRGDTFFHQIFSPTVPEVRRKKEGLCGCVRIALHPHMGSFGFLFATEGSGHDGIFFQFAI